MSFHLAQVNIARMRNSIDHASMVGLASHIEEMNQLAERSQGFIWRLLGSEATPDALHAFEEYFVPFEPARLFYNLSVWNSVEDLKRFVYRTRHSEMLRGKDEWMASFERPSLAMWWVPIGHHPTIAESAGRLRGLHDRGPTEHAFTFARCFPKPAA